MGLDQPLQRQAVLFDEGDDPVGTFEGEPPGGIVQIYDAAGHRAGHAGGVAQNVGNRVGVNVEKRGDLGCGGCRHV